jgi:magnesium-transporting ATPase (P-type)
VLPPLCVQGAPEIVLQSCTHHFFKGEHSDWRHSAGDSDFLTRATARTVPVAGEEVPIDESFMKHFEEVYKEIAGQGERVLGFARRLLPLVRAWRDNARLMPRSTGGSGSCDRKCSI